MSNVIQIKDYKSLSYIEGQKKLKAFFEEVFFILALPESDFNSEENTTQISSETNNTISLDFLMTKKQQEIYRRAVDAGVADIDGFFYMLDHIGDVRYDDLKF